MNAARAGGCLLERARRYARLDAHPQIACRTRFFAAAALVTRALVHMPTQFLLGLSERLEGHNRACAREITRGHLYALEDVRRNTRHFIHYEQTLVQQELGLLRRAWPLSYLRELALVNTALTIVSEGRAPRGCDATFVAAVATARRRCGVALDFARQAHREHLGWAIAQSVMRDSLSHPQWRLPGCASAQSFHDPFESRHP